MLEVVHDYALEKLQASGEEENVRSLHAAYFLEIPGGEAAPSSFWARMRSMVEKLEQEHDNIRGVLRWSLNSGNATLALRLGWELCGTSVIAGHSMEGRRWLEEAVAAGADAPALVYVPLGMRALGHWHNR